MHCSQAAGNSDLCICLMLLTAERSPAVSNSLQSINTVLWQHHVALCTVKHNVPSAVSVDCSTSAATPAHTCTVAQSSPCTLFLLLLPQQMHITCERVQISHTFFDAPGAQAATFIEGRDADLAPGAKPYVTMVFCGPADYKVNL